MCWAEFREKLVNICKALWTVRSMTFTVGKSMIKIFNEPGVVLVTEVSESGIRYEIPLFKTTKAPKAEK